MIDEKQERIIAVQANFEKVYDLLKGATFQNIDEDLDIILENSNGRTFVISVNDGCLSVSSADITIDITPNDFVD